MKGLLYSNEQDRRCDARMSYNQKMIARTRIKWPSMDGYTSIDGGSRMSVCGLTGPDDEQDY